MLYVFDVIWALLEDYYFVAGRESSGFERGFKQLLLPHTHEIILDDSLKIFLSFSRGQTEIQNKVKEETFFAVVTFKSLSSPS